MSSSSRAVICSRCGKTISKAGQKSGVRCLSCQRWFHKKCFMSETGVKPKMDSLTSKSCACCLSTTLEDAGLRRLAPANKYATDFLINGFCVIPLSEGKTNKAELVSQLASWGDEVIKYFYALMKTHECLAEFEHSAPTLESDYSNFRERCPGRFEIIADFISDKVVPLVENSKTVQETLSYLLCCPKLQSDKKLMSSGCFLSLLGSETQNYHTDGPRLSDVVDLFPYAVNVFVPLVPVDSRNGTEFVPQSQMIGAGEKVKSVRPSVDVGYALLFDYRVVHRGLRNAKLDPRPCYYATYSQSWYQDTYNFSAERYRRRLEVRPDLLELRSERMAKRHKAENA